MIVKSFFFCIKLWRYLLNHSVYLYSFVSKTNCSEIITLIVWSSIKYFIFISYDNYPNDDIKIMEHNILIMYIIIANYLTKFLF